MSRNAASIVAAIGASGSGKSLWLKQRLAALAPYRLLIWDPQDEYGQGPAVRSIPNLVELVKKAGAGQLAAVYRPGNDLTRYAAQFDRFCRIAYLWQRCTVLVDELGDVTKPGWAPDGWSLIIRKGRHAGLRIFAAAQRPAIIDKTFFGLATLIHCGRLNYQADVKTMSDVLGVDHAEIVTLRPLQWIERDMQTGRLVRGAIDPAATSPTKAKKARPLDPDQAAPATKTD